jgi:hypothetical protein
MNIELLKKVAEAIKRRPEQIEMDTWFELRTGAGECGTTACIAGWAVTIADEGVKRKPLLAAMKLFPDFQRDGKISGRYNENMIAAGAVALGISDSEAVRLFLRTEWPQPFREQLANESSGSKAYAQVVYDRIQHFITTDGRE